MNTDIKGKVYATKDISDMVGIATPTVRKYAQALEKSGYSFTKNENGFRIFSEKDVFVFNEIKNLSKRHAMPVNKISEMLVSSQKKQEQYARTVPMVGESQSSSNNPGDITRYDAQYSELIEKLSKLDRIDYIIEETRKIKEVNQMLVEQLKVQQELIAASLQERDQKLVHSMKLSMELKQIKNQLEEIKAALFDSGSTQHKKRFFGILDKT